MDTSSYPDFTVMNIIAKNYVPLRVNYDQEPWATDFRITATPALVVLDAMGTEQQRYVGILPPEELCAWLLLGIAKVRYGQDRFVEGAELFAMILSDYPASGVLAEAIYWQAVCQYKSAGDPQPLKKAYVRLRAEFPDNEWTKRAAPYRLL